MTSMLEPLRARGLIFALLLLGASIVPACRNDMETQQRVDAYEPSPVFTGETSARLPPSGTISFDEPANAPHLNAGAEDGHLALRFPFPVTLTVMRRGQERYRIYCQPCHGARGRGDGPVAERGFFPPVANLQTEVLRNAAVGHIFGVITNGFNAMPAYGEQIPVRDRWAIIAYLRALQYSQHAPLTDVPQDVLKKLEQGAVHAP